MANVKVKLNYSGFNKLRTAPGVEAELLRRAARIVAAAGEGYVAEISSSRKRARVTVHPNTWPAEYDNAKNNTLVRNMDAAR